MQYSTSIPRTPISRPKFSTILVQADEQAGERGKRKVQIGGRAPAPPINTTLILSLHEVLKNWAEMRSIFSAGGACNSRMSLTERLAHRACAQRRRDRMHLRAERGGRARGRARGAPFSIKRRPFPPKVLWESSASERFSVHHHSKNEKKVCPGHIYKTQIKPAKTRKCAGTTTLINENHKIK